MVNDLLVLGCLMEGTILLVVVPAVPTALGIDMVHFGVAAVNIMSA